MKTVIILRGLPGSGKTRFSDFITPGWVISMDHYWTRNGDPYKFDYDQLDRAIEWTHEQFLDRLHHSHDFDVIIVDNVNYNREHFQFFVDEAKKVDAMVFFVHVERPMDELDSKHAVPADKILEMLSKWEPIL